MSPAGLGPVRGSREAAVRPRCECSYATENYVTSIGVTVYGVAIGGSADHGRADVYALAARLGRAPPAGAASLGQRILDDLVAIIDEERRRRMCEDAAGISAAGRKLPWPLRKVVERTLVR